MSKRMIKRTGERVVLYRPTPGRVLTARQRKELEALSTLPDHRIDTSDIPELPSSVLQREGVIGKFYRPIKKPVTIRLDADVIEWLKADGKGYQTKANALLRDRMLTETTTPKRARR